MGFPTPPRDKVFLRCIGTFCASSWTPAVEERTAMCAVNRMRINRIFFIFFRKVTENIQNDGRKKYTKIHQHSKKQCVSTIYIIDYMTLTQEYTKIHRDREQSGRIRAKGVSCLAFWHCSDRTVSRLPRLSHWSRFAASNS